MRAVTAGIMREIDRRAREEYGISSETLMDNAGQAAAEVILSDIKHNKSKNVIILCGKGNNGGDGFVIGRYLYENGFMNIGIFTSPVSEIKHGAAKTHFDRIKNSEIQIRSLGAFLETDYRPGENVIVDALFGTGFKGHMRDEYLLIGKKVNHSGSFVYSIDVPSGLNATSGVISSGCVKADKTITFGLPKQGFYSGSGAEVCGEIIVADIGFPAKLLEEYL